MNELIAACPLVIGVLIRIWEVDPALIEAGTAVAWGAWRTRLLELDEPSVAYPFDMVVSNLLVVWVCRLSANKSN